MRIVKFLLFVLVVSLPFALPSRGEEMKPEGGKESAAPSVSPTDQQGAGKAEQKDAGHDHSTMKEKRFVAEVGADGIQRVEITGGEYYFDPNHIVVKVNIPVEFKVKKTSGYVPHDLLVKAPDAGIDFRIDLKDDWQTVKFTPTKTGIYEMDCDKKLLWFKSHKDRGMHGMIEVVP